MLHSRAIHRPSPCPTQQFPKTTKQHSASGSLPGGTTAATAGAAPAGATARTRPHCHITATTTTRASAATATPSSSNATAPGGRTPPRCSSSGCSTSSSSGPRPAIPTRGPITRPPIPTGCVRGVLWCHVVVWCGIRCVPFVVIAGRLSLFTYLRFGGYCHDLSDLNPHTIGKTKQRPPASTTTAVYAPIATHGGHTNSINSSSNNSAFASSAALPRAELIYDGSAHAAGPPPPTAPPAEVEENAQPLYRPDSGTAQW